MTAPRALSAWYTYSSWSDWTHGTWPTWMRYSNWATWTLLMPVSVLTWLLAALHANHHVSRFIAGIPILANHHRLARERLSLTLTQSIPLVMLVVGYGCILRLALAWYEHRYIQEFRLFSSGTLEGTFILLDAVISAGVVAIWIAVLCSMAVVPRWIVWMWYIAAFVSPLVHFSIEFMPSIYHVGGLYSLNDFAACSVDDYRMLAHPLIGLGLLLMMLHLLLFGRKEYGIALATFWGMVLFVVNLDIITRVGLVDQAAVHILRLWPGAELLETSYSWEGPELVVSFTNLSIDLPYHNVFLWIPTVILAAQLYVYYLLIRWVLTHAKRG